MVVTHKALERAIGHAEASDYVRRNVAALVRPPTGQQERPSKSFTMNQAAALLRTTEGRFSSEPQFGTGKHLLRSALSSIASR